MARKFNGTSDAVQIAIDLSSYSLISVSFWLWWDTFANDDKMALEYGATDYNTQNGFLCLPNSSSSSSKVEVAVGVPTNNRWGDAFTRPSAGAWHHYLIIFDRSTPANTVYVDGVLQSLTTTVHNAVAYGNFSNTMLNVMSRASTSLFGAGRMAELAIYGGVALSKSEAVVLAVGNDPRNVRTANLVGYYRMQYGQSPEPDSSAAAAPSGTVKGGTFVTGPSWLTRIFGPQPLVKA